MSTSLQNDIFEAELVDNNAPNPYATPAAIEIKSQISDGIGRASQREIDIANKSLIAGEISYVACTVLYVLSWYDSSDIVILAWMLSIMVALFFFARMVMSCNEVNLTSLGMIFTFPIPVFGTLIFLAGKKQVARFLTWNGYRLGFLGAHPDIREIERMNANPHYRPSGYINQDGSKRRQRSTLSDWFLKLLALLLIASLFFQ